ncbi:WxL protein peptidoglycan domain-containing protein [Yinghuangia sp. YIM S09857]|uniref:WxL protein peptidoglycan domain-containing protein n=1 Tax=Yinghuangia sp. YIM S09857 TaxID=3436929 RepID=UPI003F52F982
MTDTSTERRHRAARPRRTGLRARSLALLAAVFTVLAGLLVGPAPAAHAASNGDWSVDPFVPPGTDQNNRRYFFLEAAAGETVTDTVVVANTSNRKLTFKVFGADAFNTPRDGAFSVRRLGDPMKGVGLWLKVGNGQDTVEVEPGTRVAIPFQIVIPANATSGDHVGGIMALNNETIGQQQEGQLRVDLKMQVGARIYLKVRGPSLPAMDVRDVRVERATGFGEFFGSDKAVIRYTITNTGNVIIRPQTELKVSGLFGRTLLTKKSDPGNQIEIFPGEKVELVQTWNDAPLLDRVDVQVSAVTEQENQRLTDKSSTSYTAVPWPALLVLALLLIGGGVAWQLMRNRKSGGGNSGDKAENQGPKAPSGGESAPTAGGDKVAGSAEGSGAGDKKDKPKETVPASSADDKTDEVKETVPASSADHKTGDKSEAKKDPETEAKTEAKTEVKAEGKKDTSQETAPASAGGEAADPAGVGR